MRFPQEDDLCRERARFMHTIESLTDAEFENGNTLCDAWAPRDVLAHIVGSDTLGAYFRPSGLTIARTNAKMVLDAKRLSRPELTERGWKVTESPARASRMFAAVMMCGDVVMHHQDILRGLGKPHALPPEAKPAIMQEALLWHSHLLLRYRIVPTDGRARGRGREVHGTTEALAMWLGGRKGIEPELRFA
ncbi:maleylpyruvate isomerase family mycothiol-dependent enzyme [Nocardioides speluncae]|uniref:maleylpyruvate isomerase family mycothiol-dependent enzyme n=1 Tax=Nocardioides speluncae TaxID=2670337 RepID=UPI000D68BAB3|nr:maleylpyruvate isomerase family mycothiol-dependent enzyme [Nocardioides speluncae]